MASSLDEMDPHTRAVFELNVGRELPKLRKNGKFEVVVPKVDPEVIDFLLTIDPGDPSSYEPRKSVLNKLKKK